MLIENSVEQVVIYHRSGFRTVLLTLGADGAVKDPPGHAEQSWQVQDNGALTFRDRKGNVTAELILEGNVYRGKLLSRYQVQLMKIDHSAPDPARDMKVLMCIPFVNRLDLLREAVAGVADAFAGRIVLIDNSDAEELHTSDLAASCEIFTPPVPLSFTQTQNLMQKLADQRSCDVLCFMHNDGRVAPAAAMEFLRGVERIWRANPRFGVIFTHYDVLCAFNMRAVHYVGRWDTVFTQYYADNDYYRRIEEAGFEKLQLPIVVEHVGSATLASDSLRAKINSLFFPVFGRYFDMKHS